jgi:hypothetical protein
MTDSEQPPWVVATAPYVNISARIVRWSKLCANLTQRIQRSRIKRYRQREVKSRNVFFSLFFSGGLMHLVVAGPEISPTLNHVEKN